MGRFADKLFIDPENWRAGILRLLLVISLIFGLTIYIPSLIISVASGLYGLVGKRSRTEHFLMGSRKGKLGS